MPHPELWAGALSLVLHYDLTGCTLAVRRAAVLLEQLSEQPGVDAQTRTLCACMSERLGSQALSS